MQRRNTYDDTSRYQEQRGGGGSAAMGESMTVAGNAVALILAGVAVAGAVIGLLVGFEIIGTDNPFQNGLLWLVGGAVAGLGANAFRREHHVVSEAEALGAVRGQRNERLMQRRGERAGARGEGRDHVGGRDIAEFEGMTVVALSEAREVGEVKDVLFDPTERAILGLLVSPADHPDTRMFVGRDHLRGFGQDAVTIESERNLQSFTSKERERQVTEAGIHIRGAKVISERGDSLGKIDKVLVNEDGTIAGYSCKSGAPGFGSDDNISPSQVVSIGEETVIIRVQVAPAQDEERGRERGRGYGAQQRQPLAGGDEGTGLRERRGSRMDEPYERQSFGDETTTTGGPMRYEEHPDDGSGSRRFEDDDRGGRYGDQERRGGGPMDDERRGGGRYNR